MRPKLAMGGGAKDCLPCPTACPVRAKCMHPFHVQNTPNLTWCSHQTLDPFQPPLASPWLGFLKSKTTSLSQPYLPVGVPSAAPPCRALT